MATSREGGEYGVLDEEQVGNLEGFEHDLCHLVPGGLGLEVVGEEEGVVSRVDVELGVGVADEGLVVVVIGHDSILEDGLDLEGGSWLVEGFIAKEGGVGGDADVGGGMIAGNVLSAEAGLEVQRADIEDDRQDFIANHLIFILDAQ